ncbi:protein late bloomer-like [Teleopsis dalmanni]|uniref:protein late bloomer-like n=1 Tax=Teleopsis dalmanni TaxID=139649 RepID=UPI0018CCF59E|nr:protein late bloomer-like [Teleopsis dalmanni]
MACSTQTLKVFALFWDAVFAILGLILLGLGVYIVIEFEHFNNVAIVVLTAGIIVTLSALFGSWSAAREKSCWSKGFVVLLVILVILQLLIVAFFWIFETSLLINVDKTFDQLWREQPTPIKPGNASQIASLERWLECCGKTGPKDYLLPPYSCYNHNEKLNADGCRQKFLDYVSDRWIFFNIFVLVLVLVELICAAFAYVLANSILNRWRRSKYYPK